ASAGVVDTSAAQRGPDDRLILAEVASRGAKDRGGNQIALFQDIDSSIIQRRSDVDKVGFLQMALIENRFTLHAQRIHPIGATSGQKFELLARLDWDGATDTSPANFLSAAERYQLMAAFDRWVINAALTQIANADSPLEIGLCMFSINISAQSIQDSTFVEFIESRIAETGVAPDTLCFELTETSLVRHLNRAQKFVHRIQRLGCHVALDDFGTGYSSFAYLKSLPVNYLKIDGVFVRDILENSLSKAVVSSVIQIADVIGAQTVAEHVETPMVQTYLQDAGIHFVQGFAIHRPQPFKSVLDELHRSPNVVDFDELLDLRVPGGTLKMQGLG
ncbi:MAG: EAL domain-containing protein, partial [Pseudomonadota bacterium]